MNILNQLCSQIVCPPKLTYSSYDLGSIFNNHGRRTDFECFNRNGLKIKCSLYTPTRTFENNFTKHQSNNIHFNSLSDICVIYLHSMNGSRLQSTGYAQSILSKGYSFCNFDFSGCGNSDGTSISFGANEKYDAEAVVKQLHKNFSLKKFILWGRSMGAVCGVKLTQMLNTQSYEQKSWKNIYQKYETKQIEILALILDSPFKSFRELAIQLGQKMSIFPKFMVSAGFHIIKSNIEQLGKFDLQQLEIWRILNKLQLPIMFLTSKADTTIPSKHSEDLYQMYQHIDKQLIFINGLHNESRDRQYLSHINRYINKMLINYIHNAKKKMHHKSKKRINDLIAQNRFQKIDGEHQQNNFCHCTLFQKPKMHNRQQYYDYLKYDDKAFSLSNKTSPTAVSMSNRR